jgi:hypothetical protein
MRVILDECIPRQLGRELAGRTVTTVAHAGWSGVANGHLLALINGQFDAFLTVDKNLLKDRSTSGLTFRTVLLRAASNALEDLALLSQVRS